MRELFFERAKNYFGDDYESFLKELNNSPRHGFFLNTAKKEKSEIINLIDFEYSESGFNPNAYFCNSDNIGKTKVYELGLIYPQDVESSYPSVFVDTKDKKIILDLCSAPGGKAINMLNKADKDALLIANDISYKRATILSSNFERLGLTNTIVTCKDPKDLTHILEGTVDIVILDAPCSGEGMIRKYPEILEKYELDNILELAQIQKDLLDAAYNALKEGGQLIYSTCTYAFEEDEDQIHSFLQRHPDMKLIDLKDPHSSMIRETIKLSFLDGTEGQYMALMIKRNNYSSTKLKYLKTVKNNVVERFIKDNLTIDNYYLYKDGDKYYLSFQPIIDLGRNVLRFGVYLGDLIKDRFEPAHSMFRSNQLNNCFKYSYELNDKQYESFIKGLEIFDDLLENHYYLVTYKNISLGFGKSVNGTLKNKYPKGLRRVL